MSTGWVNSKVTKQFDLCIGNELVATVRFDEQYIPMISLQTIGEQLFFKKLAQRSSVLAKINPHNFTMRHVESVDSTVTGFTNTDATILLRADISREYGAGYFIITMDEVQDAVNDAVLTQSLVDLSIPGTEEIKNLIQYASSSFATELLEKSAIVIRALKGEEARPIPDLSLKEIAEFFSGVHGPKDIDTQVKLITDCLDKLVKLNFESENATYTEKAEELTKQAIYESTTALFHLFGLFRLVLGEKALLYIDNELRAKVRK